MYVIVTETPWAVLHTDTEDRVHMQLEGTIVELIMALNTQLYRKYI